VSANSRQDYTIPNFRFTPPTPSTIFGVCLAQVISQLSCAIVAAIPTSPPLLRSILAELTTWDTRPDYLRAAAHEWCSVISKNYQKINDGEELIFHCLEIGFRGIDFEYRWPDAWPRTQLTYTKHYQHIADIVSNGGSDETIADLLQAWIIHSHANVSLGLLKPWATLLIRLGRVAPTPRRLRLLAIYSVLFLGFQLGFNMVELAEVEEFVMLLNRLGIGIRDIPAGRNRCRLLVLLLEVIQSHKGRQSLSYSYWELIPELALSLAVPQGGCLEYHWLGISQPPDGRLPESINYVMRVMVSLEEEQEWDRLECWMGFVWFVLRPKIDSILEIVERLTLSLLRQRPGVAEKLEQRLQRVTLRDTSECLECLRQVCERAGLEAASRQNASWVAFSTASCTLNECHSRLVSSVNAETREPARPPPPTLPLLVWDDTY